MTREREDAIWALAKADPEVEAAQAALAALDTEEDRLTLELGRALRRAITRAEERVDTDPGTVVRVHNHPPSEPPCAERVVITADGSRHRRGACLNGDGSPR